MAANTYRIYFMNFGYSEYAATIEDAKATAKRIGFEARIDGPDGRRICCYSPLYGWS